MSSTQDIAHTSEFPEELSHLSIPGHPHREPASDFVHEGNTLPMPPAPNSPVPTLPSLDSHLSGSELGLGYVRVDLPQDNQFLFTHGRCQESPPRSVRRTRFAHWDSRRSANPGLARKRVVQMGKTHWR